MQRTLDLIRQFFKRFLPLTFISFILSCDTEENGTTVENQYRDYVYIKATLNLDPNDLPNYANPAYPIHYNAPLLTNLDNTPSDNPVTNKGAALGRVLFYDKKLSINNTVACASCHKQSLGFTDEKKFSPGFSGSAFTSAHSMRMGNSRFSASKMFWDKRANTLEAQATQPFQNSVEMGFDVAHGGLDSLLKKINTLPYYAELFYLVYGDTVITENRIQKAIAQFGRSLVSVRSRWDDGYALVYNAQDQNNGLNNTVPGLTAEENNGRMLFLTPPPQGGAGCAGCHIAPTFALTANSQSNGLDSGETTIFKSPSLKNIALTGPYMHDGRLSTLEQVVEHYNSGIKPGPALDNKLKDPGGNPIRLNLSAAGKAALVAFMKTLTDTVLISDPKFADPFK